MTLHKYGSDPIAPHPGPFLVEEAARAVDELVAQLEPELDREQCRLLHRLRLASESLGMLRATADALTRLPAPHGDRPPPLP